MAKSPFSAYELLIGLLLMYPAHLSLIEQVTPTEEEAEKELYSLALSTYNEDHSGDALNDLSKDGRERVSVLLLYCEEHFGVWSEANARQEIQKLCQSVNRSFLRKKQQYLIQELKTARTLGKKLEEEKLLTQYQQVLKLQHIAS